jgi:glutamine synthetase
VLLSKFFDRIKNNFITGRVFSPEELDMGFSNIQVTGLNFEVAPGQCEFQIFGKGIHAADSYYMFKYILERTAEKHGVDIEYNPKPVEGDWNGSGCHTNYSIESMRKKHPSSYKVILDSIEKLRKKHDLHIDNYGEGNKKRLTGKHETQSID